MVDKVVRIDEHLARTGAARSARGVSTTAGSDQSMTPSCKIPAAHMAAWEAALGRALMDKGKLSDTDFAKVVAMRRDLDADQSLSTMLVQLGLVAEADVALALAEVLDLPLAERRDYADEPLADVELTERFLKERMIVPLAVANDELRLAMADPNDTFARQAVGLASGRRVCPVVGLPSEIERAIDVACSPQRTDTDDALSLAGDELDVEQLKDMASEAPVIRLVNTILQRASKAGASDIHIEPFDGRLAVRCRVDGVLQEIESPPPRLAAAVISRIKIMSRLDIAERRLPQDGRLKLRLHGREVDVRVSTAPTLHGESVVMRLLNRGDVVLDLKALGFDAPTRQCLRRALALPHGLILVTGPTGSGKTTTLYTALNILNTQARKIITAEDPVEYQIDGINQIQVRPAIDLTFANVLRAIVRQDPDVILVGEMRDLETARICVQSALTGHLVLSTLHTNSALSSITRLLEMGVEDYLLTSTLNVIVSQRLVRVLCGECRQAYRPVAGLLDELGVTPEEVERTPSLYRAVGCEDCAGTGYKGRTVIQEALTITDDVRRCIADHADTVRLERAARDGGLRSIWQDGCAKALAGITSVEEVSRVVRES